ncbi:4-hydroxy-tetrahydrodipicolinate synthase [Buchnera aphidicola (Thelaxes californica)]|uniref:4-hydroxy-tetrahydrodipicolinate synthase n=1 Tax=Buchnera aphidicola (Thelaxes californica) TaxID=1315998 RepID=A0A4D6YKY3_9GAMM|nr:4-hydroxy-tetrahydrodipicolinate synthase [Buchnera aphidicola]QCI26634.1 4-hydroxy-tetrahydrodipicolinate synthase [Buchnera aphidicola (Thelaxes californica)]
MFKGSIVALITPMDEKGKLCPKSLKNLITYHIKNNTSAIVSVGTTGESSTLSQKEHINLVLRTVDLVEKKIPIIAGTGSNATEESINLTQKFENVGISACLSVTPYYNRPTQKGLYEHFKSISENTSLPQILYNIPIRTGCDLLPETIAKLAKYKNIIGIKEATGDLSRINQIKTLIKKNFLLLSGDDATALDFIKLGGDGVISVTANIAAKEMAQMCRIALKEDYYNAQLINQLLMPLHKYLFIETNPIPVKWAAQKLGLIENSKLRLPLTMLSSDNKKILNNIINQFVIKTCNSS